MRRSSDYCREYLNGNITIKYDADAIEWAKRDRFLTISEALSWLDCSFVGDPCCIGNFDIGYMVYNCHSDLIYMFNMADLDRLEAGKMIRLYARPVSGDDRATIEEGY